MKCLCTKTCFIKHETEKCIFYEKGKVYDFQECPDKYFKPTEELNIDFETATEDLLLNNSNWKEEDLRTFIHNRYGVRVAYNISREKLVKKLMDARYREVEEV